MLNIASSIASVVASVDCLVLYGLYCEYQFTPASGLTRFCTGPVPCF